MPHPLSLPEVLTLREATAALAALAAAVEQQPAQALVQMNASALQKFDSSALAVLLECRRVALGSGRSFAVQGLPESLQGLARLYGVLPLLAADTA